MKKDEKNVESSLDEEVKASGYQSKKVVTPVVVSVRLHGPKVATGLQPCITEDGRDLYLVPSIMCGGFSEAKFIPITLTGEVLPGEQWNAEIERMLPSRSEMVENARRSFWAAGLYTREDMDDMSKRRNATRTAYPYKLELR